MADAHGESVAVVIVNYRTPQLTLDCIETLARERQQFPNLHVYLVENASPDDSYPQLATAIAARGWNWVTLLAASENRGFSAGNNVGLQAIQATTHEYIWLLNPDTLVEPGATVALVHFMQAHPKVGITGSYLRYPDGRFQTGAFRFPNMLGEFEDMVRLGIITKLFERWRVSMKEAQQPHPCDWINGASLMLRHGVLNAIGLMDEAFFLYFEETEYCFRAKKAGWEVWHVPESHVIHIAGQSTGVTGTQATQKRRPQYWFDSRARYYRICNGRLSLFFTDIAFMLGYSISKVHRGLRRKPSQDPPHFWKDAFRDILHRWLR